jgi:Domain of unknown function (DUF4349)
MRLRDEEKLSAEVESDLAALDAALAGDPVPEDEALADLARELRAERPVAEPRFGAELDARAAEGFRGAGPTRPLTRLRERLAAAPPRRMLAPAGALATLVVVAGVALSQTSLPGGGGGGDAPLTVEPAEQPGGGAQQQPGGAGADAESDVPADQAIEPGLVEPPSTGLDERNGLAPGQHERKVERAAQITLSTEPDEVPDVADGVIEVGDRYRGIVVASQVSESAEGRSVARIELAIPATDLQDALADLSELADVSSRNESTLDVTEPFVSARERLADARAELDSLLTQLAEADTPRETRAIRARMDIVRGEIAAARNELESIARRARFARVSVTVEGDGGSDGGDGWTLGDAADDAVDVLRTVAGVALVSLAVLLPVLTIATIGCLIGRTAARRRRERALD